MAGSIIKELVYRLTADASGVERGMDKADAAVESKLDLIRRQKAIIKLQGDSSDLDRNLRAARLKVDRLKKDKASIGIDADTSGLERGIALAEAEVANLRRQKAEIKVELDRQGQAYQAARRLTSQVGQLNKQVEDADNLFERWGKRITGARVNLGPFTTNLRTLMGVLVVMGPVISGLVGSIVALGGSLAEATAGGIAVASAGFAGLALSAGGAALALMPLKNTFKEVSAAQLALKTAQDKYGKSSDEAKNAAKQLDKVMAAAPPHIQEVEKRWTSLKNSFQARTGTIRDDAVGVINNAMRTAQKLMPSFARQASQTFHVAALGVNNWLDGLRSPEAQHILNEIMVNFRRALPDLLRGTGDFATGIARITAAASHFLPSFTKGFANVAHDFEQSTENAGDLQHTIGGLVDQTHAWFGLLGATGRLLATVLEGGASSGENMIQDFTKTLNDWNKALQTTSGQRSMQQFFSDSASTTEQFVSALRRAITMLFALSRATQPFAQGALEVVNAIGDIVTEVTKLTPLRAILVGVGAAMATAFAVTKIAAFVRVLGEIPGAIREVVTAFRAGEIAINPLLGLLSLAAGAFAALALETHGAASAQDRVNRLQHESVSAAHRATAAVRNERDAYRDLRSAALDLAQAHIDVKQARLALASATRRANAAEDKYGKNSRQAKQANLDERQAAIDLRYAKRSVADASNRESDSARKVNRENAKETAGRQKAVTALVQQRQVIQQNIQADRKIMDATRGNVDMSGEYSNATKDLSQQQDRLKQNTGDLRTAQGKLSDTVQKGSKLFGYMGGPTAIGKASNAEDQMKSKSGNLQSQLRTLGRTLGGVAGTSHSMGNMIGAVTNKILDSFGVKQLHFSLPSISSVIGGLFQTGGVVGEQRRASGGFIVPGHGDGDSFRTALPPGSFILNRNATRAMGFQSGGAMAPVALEPGELALGPGAASAIGYGALNAINSAVPRFQSGGQFAGMKPEIVALTKNILSRFGGVMSAGYATSGHAPNSLHYQGLAADIVPDNWTGATNYVNSIGSQLLEGIHASPPGTNVSWKNGQRVPPSFWGSATWSEHFSHIHVATASAIKSLAARIKQIAVKGPAGPLRDALQAQADHLRSAANSYIKKRMPQQGPEASFGNFKGQSVRGKVSWFTGAGTAGGGNASTDPGIAVNLQPGTDSGWNNPTTQKWMQMARAGHPEMAGVNIQGHSAVLPIIDLGPAGFTNRAIDVTAPGVRRLGFTTSGFPTDAIGTAKMKQRGGVVGMQSGGGVGPGGPGATGGRPHGGHRHHHGRGHGNGHGHPVNQHLRLPPKPHKNRRHDFGTGPGTWYDWYTRAIDFYDQRGDARNDDGKLGPARTDWRSAMGDIQAEEHQIRRIIQHDHNRIHHLTHQHQPKHLRKSKPGPFHFRNRNKGESHKDYHKAKRTAHAAWKAKMRTWKQQKREWEQGIRERKRSIKQELPDLYQQLRVDLPTRYKEIQDKITGQSEDVALQQTAFGQERYDALLNFAGNFSPLGFGVGSNLSRFGAAAGAATSMSTGLLATSPTAVASAAGTVPGLGVRAPRSAAGVASVAGGPTHIDNSKTIHITQRYEREPKDPHTWSASMRHELGALS